VFLTDGQDTNSGGYTYDQLIDWAKRDGVVVHTIGLGPGINSALLQDIADGTGGPHLFGNADDLIAYYEAIRAANNPTHYNSDGITDYYTDLLTNPASPTNTYPALLTGTKTRVFGTASYTQVQEGLVDFDGDGTVSSAEKTQAMKDFDGDGIINGDEVEITAQAVPEPYPTQGMRIQVIAKLKSSPIHTDSDGDGYGDKTENDWTPAHDPMVSDVKRYTLRHPDYVPVGIDKHERGGWNIDQQYLDNGSNSWVHYGGSQMWFYDENGLGGPRGGYSERLQSMGCGVMAAADLLIYLGSSNGQYNSLRTSFPDMDWWFTYSSPFPYRDYAQLIHDLRVKMLWEDGPLAWRLANVFVTPPWVFIEQLNEAYGDRIVTGHTAAPQTVITRFPFNEAPSAQFVKDQLGANLPVPILHAGVYYRIPFVDEHNAHVIGEDLYRDRNRSGVVDDDDYEGWRLLTPGIGLPGDDYYSLSIPASNDWDDYINHYVVITEYYEDGFDGKNKVIVASWGGKLVMEFGSVHSGGLGGYFELTADPS
jgi:hypothetical protein